MQKLSLLIKVKTFIKVSQYKSKRYDWKRFEKNDYI